jgi:predicted MFS family arabinose efflux permease
MPEASVRETFRQFLGPMHLALALTGFVLVGVCAIAVGLLMDPVMSEFHWSNASTSAMATVYSLACMLSGPVVGVLIDRIGSKLVMVAGVVLVAAGFLALSLCHRLGEFYAAFAVIGVGYGGAFFLGSSTLIAKLGAQKNVGMGIWMFAGSTGAAFFSFAVARTLNSYGWRATTLAAALLVAGTVPVILVAIPRHRPERAAASTHVRPVAIPWRLFLAPAFLLLSAASALAAFGMNAVYFHAVPILLKNGFSGQSAGAIFGASWIVSAVGSLVLGMMSDRLGTANVLKGSFLCGALGTLALLATPSVELGMVAALAFIVLWGVTANAGNQFLPILFVEQFGPVHLGVLVGVQGALMGLVGSFAPLVTGALYDRYATYVTAICASVATTLLAAGLVAFLRRPDAARLADAAAARAAIH